MAGRKKRDDEEERLGPEPFNNPFSTSLAALRRQMRQRGAAPPPGRNDRERAATAPNPRRKSERDAPPRNDSEEFLDAAVGARPIAKRNARVRAKAQPKSVVVHNDDDVIDFTADEHFDMRFSDRYIRASTAGVSNETLAKLARGEFAVRSHVDLHGMALDDARQAVDEFLSDRHRRGDRCVLVITGKGRNSRQQLGVLREKIPEWLARGPSARRVLAFVTARQCDGGEGAMYVLLRKHVSAKGRIDVVAGGGA
jgi:DNA-nicking Smr family endonuclease